MSEATGAPRGARADGEVVDAGAPHPEVVGAVDAEVIVALTDLVTVMDRLRSPGGCPWDAEQTHASLLPYAIEEVFEVVEAVEAGDREGLREELGDLLLQVVFHARVAQEDPAEPFGLAEVAAGVAAKLRHRHPHVFGDVEVAGAEDVHRRWEQIKRDEKTRASALDGIPAGMPALARAEKVIGRARRAGLPVPGTAHAEARQGSGEAAQGSAESARAGDDAERLGRELLTLAIRAEAAGLDAEAALRGAVRDLEHALRAAERGAGGDGNRDERPATEAPENALP